MLFNDSWKIWEIGEFEMWWECKIFKVVFFNSFQEHYNTPWFYLCEVNINSCTLSASPPEKLLPFLTWNCCLIEYFLKIDIKIDLSHVELPKWSYQCLGNMSIEWMPASRYCFDILALSVDLNMSQWVRENLNFFKTASFQNLPSKHRHRIHMFYPLA